MRIGVDFDNTIANYDAVFTEAARGRGMRSLRDAAVALVLRGESTLEELERVTLAD